MSANCLRNFAQLSMNRKRISNTVDHLIKVCDKIQTNKITSRRSVRTEWAWVMKNNQAALDAASVAASPIVHLIVQSATYIQRTIAWKNRIKADEQKSTSANNSESISPAVYNALHICSLLAEESSALLYLKTEIGDFWGTAQCDNRADFSVCSKSLHPFLVKPQHKTEHLRMSIRRAFGGTIEVRMEVITARRQLGIARQKSNSSADQTCRVKDHWLERMPWTSLTWSCGLTNGNTCLRARTVGMISLHNQLQETPHQAPTVQFWLQHILDL